MCWGFLGSDVGEYHGCQIPNTRVKHVCHTLDTRVKPACLDLQTPASGSNITHGCQTHANISSLLYTNHHKNPI